MPSTVGNWLPFCPVLTCALCINVARRSKTRYPTTYTTCTTKRPTVRRVRRYGHYLLGLVFKGQKNNSSASGHFVKATQGAPLHWGGWQELASLAVDAADFTSMKALPLPTHWVRDFFVAHLALTLHMPEEAVSLYTKLLDQHPASNSLRGQLAETYYEDRKFDDAQVLLEQLRKDDPFRLENMDTYSNILYVKELKPQLSYLAHESTKIDQYRVETCCVVGNYYSLKGRHEKAVLYFRRALKLDRKYLAAWTLMGHEYLELKNPPAAIEAYRRAVDTNPMDYRAWYGLGQTYELLKMPTYSLYYFRQSQRLRPYDARMWTAMAQTYKELQQWSHAAKCYERNIDLNPVDTKALHFLGFIYIDNLEPPNHDKAAFYFRKAIDVAGEDVEENENTLRAYEFLAEHYRDKEMYVGQQRKHLDRPLNAPRSREQPLARSGVGVRAPCPCPVRAGKANQALSSVPSLTPSLRADTLTC